MPKLRIVIADDNEEIVRIVSKMVNSRYELVGVCNDGESAVHMVSKLKPDVALLDISMPRLDGLKVVGHLRVTTANTKIIMLTGLGDQDFINLAFKAGAHGFVVKRRMHSDLHTAIETVLSGAEFVSPLKTI